MKQITGILLAAGSSRRFGADKRMHPLADGTPMALASALRLAKTCRRTIVVIRPGDDALASLLTEHGIETIVCDEADQGMGHSLSCGVTASSEADGWLVALADMPYIAPSSYAAVLESLQNDAGLARPTFDGQFGHPVGFSAHYRFELLALTSDQGGKAILDAHSDDLHCCAVKDAGVLKDIDQPSQLITDPSRAGDLPFVETHQSYGLVP